MILIIIYKDIYSLPFKRNIIDKNTRNARRAWPAGVSSACQAIPG
jgi:hypothetical protein